jgi:hypothetical protein
MPLPQLLARLEQHKVTVAEKRILSDGRTVYILVAQLPSFPFGDRKHTWYSLIVEQSQTEIPRDEIEALLRHLWHAELVDFFDDLADAAGRPN